jgi:hypothetical protein
LHERKVSVRDLDAIVAANDAMALGVLDELARLGIRVPDGIAVVGFDDIEESRFGVPPLTTVRQPLYEQGRDAVRIVLDHLRKGSPAERVVRQTELVTRRSCGCPAHPGELDPERALADARAQARKRIRTEERARSLGRASAAIASAHDLDELSRAVAEHMPALGIARCYVATFNATSGDDRLARLVLVHTPDARRSEAPSWQLQSAVEILRDQVLPSAGERALAILPTVFRDQDLGVVVLELEALDGYLYETLRDVFTAALSGARRTN